MLWAVFGLALVPRITTLGGTFIVNDEPLYWEWSNGFATALLNFDWLGTLIGKGYPSITVMWVHTLGLAARYWFDLLSGYSATQASERLTLGQPLIFDLLGERRMVMGLVNAALIVPIFQQIRKLMGQGIALLGTLFLIFTPFVLADARTMRGDALMSSLMLWSSLAFLVYLKERQWHQLFISGLTLGLALLTKMVAIPVVGFIGLALGVYVWQARDWNWRRRLRWATLTLAAWGGLVAATIFALWPALWVAPLEVFTFMRNYAADSIDGRLNYFWGQLTSNGEAIPLFYPNAFLFRVTPLVLIGLAIVTGLMLISAWLLLRHGFSRGGLALAQVWQMPTTTRWTLLALGAYMVIYTIVLTLGALKRDRYLVPIFPAAMFVAAAGWWWLCQQLGRRWPGRISLLGGGRWAWLTLALLVGWELNQILATHPFYYTYWNPIMGGGRVAMQVMMAESGVDSAALVHLNQRPNAAQEKVALLTSRDYAPAYHGKIIRFLNNDPWITAEYVMLRQYHFQTEKLDADMLAYVRRQSPLDVIEFDGYTWAWVYPGPAAQYYSGSILDGKARLLGYNLKQTQITPGEALELKLFLKNLGYQPPEQLFVRLVDSSSFIWANSLAQITPEFAALAYQPGTIVEGESQLNVPMGMPPGLYFLKLGLSGGEAEPDVGEFELPGEGSRIVIDKTPPTAQPSWVQVLNQPVSLDLTLLGVEAALPDLLTPQNPQSLVLYWRVERALATNPLVSLRLLNESGETAATWAGPLGRGLYPALAGQPGDLIRDPWVLDLAHTESKQVVTPGKYTLAVALLESDSNTQLTHTELGQIELADRQRIFEAPAMQHSVGAQVGDSLILLGYDLTQAPLTGGARFSLKLYWQAGQIVSTDYTVFVQVLGPDGTVVGQHDGMPVNGSLPTTRWSQNEVVADRHQFEFPTQQTGEYRLIVGMYDPATGQRLPVAATDRTPLGDHLQLYTFTLSEAGS